MNKRVNPYQRLMDSACEFERQVAFPRIVPMWYYPKEKLKDGWKLDDLWERTKAAEQLGYDIVLKATEQGLEVRYVQKRPTWGGV